MTRGDTGAAKYSAVRTRLPLLQGLMALAKQGTQLAISAAPMMKKDAQGDTDLAM